MAGAYEYDEKKAPETNPLADGKKRVSNSRVPDPNPTDVFVSPAKDAVLDGSGTSEADSLLNFDVYNELANKDA